jgi:hypothetical protein
VKTAIAELFGIEHPIIQGGMHYVGFATGKLIDRIMAEAAMIIRQRLTGFLDDVDVQRTARAVTGRRVA